MDQLRSLQVPLILSILVYFAIAEHSLRSIIIAPLLGFAISMAWLPFVSLAEAFYTRVVSGLASSLNDPWSIRRAVASFTNYEYATNVEVSRMRTAYSRVGYSRKRIGKELNYSSKLDRLRETNEANGKITRAIARLAVDQRGPDAKPNLAEGRQSELIKVRETLKHFVRDWSSSGESERNTSFGLILEELRKTPADDRKDISVLVPGCGLGRLAWEISQLGFDTTANEISPYMFTAFHFLLSPLATNRINQHAVHPHAHWFSHQKSTESLMRSSTFPDVVPRLSKNFRLMEGDFMDLLPDSGSSLRAILPPNVDETDHGIPHHQETYRRKSYDYIVTLFFIDTSPSILNTLQQIYTLLKPGGTWINMGPLLWPSTASMELSLDEVLRATELTGFELEVLDNAQSLEVDRKSKEVPCEYTANREAMMKWIYLSRFWIARKT